MESLREKRKMRMASQEKSLMYLCPVGGKNK
jgi:hypothetical protein